MVWRQRPTDRDRDRQTETDTHRQRRGTYRKIKTLGGAKILNLNVYFSITFWAKIKRNKNFSV